MRAFFPAAAVSAGQWEEQPIANIKSAQNAEYGVDLLRTFIRCSDGLCCYQMVLPKFSAGNIAL
jgi:hypothetical protein